MTHGQAISRQPISLNRRLVPCYVLALIFSLLILDHAVHPFSNEPVTKSLISSDGIQRYFTQSAASSDFTAEDLTNLQLLKSFAAQFPDTIPQGELRLNDGDSERFDTEWMRRKWAGRETFDWLNIKNILVFGDSLSQSTSQYGEWDRSKGEIALEGAEEGRIGLKTDVKWVDALHLFYANTSEVGYHNYGSGGAVTDREIVPPWHEAWQDFASELQHYRAQLKPVLDEGAGTRLPPGWTGKDDLVIIAFGNNDEKEMARSGNREDDDKVVHALISSLMSKASQLYDDGFRHFLFVTAPPTDLMPQTTLPSEGGYEDRFITKDIHARATALLKAAVEVWDEQYAVEGNGMVFDMDGYLRIVHAFPQLFGITDLHRFWWFADNIARRPTEMGLMWNDSHGHPSGHMMKKIASAVHGFLLRRSSSMQYGDARWSGVATWHERPLPPPPAGFRPAEPDKKA